MCEVANCEDASCEPNTASSNWDVEEAELNFFDSGRPFVASLLFVRKDVRLL